MTMQLQERLISLSPKPTHLAKDLPNGTGDGRRLVHGKPAVCGVLLPPPLAATPPRLLAKPSHLRSGCADAALSRALAMAAWAMAMAALF